MTQIEKHTVDISRHGRYHKLFSINKNTKNIWLVFHGYGQLSGYFIKHFEGLNEDEHVIIAPEGLSRFYVEGFSGRIGASWMTKEDRIGEIEDQARLVNAVLKDCRIDPSDMPYRLIVLGFSQGAAVAVRWLVNNQIRPDQLILWAGSFPHDVNISSHPAIFKDLNLHFAYGDEDPFLVGVDIEEKLKMFNTEGIRLRLWPFKGKHTIDSTMLKQIVDSFADWNSSTENNIQHEHNEPDRSDK